MLIRRFPDPSFLYRARIHLFAAPLCVRRLYDLAHLAIRHFLPFDFLDYLAADAVAQLAPFLRRTWAQGAGCRFNSSSDDNDPTLNFELSYPQE
ncbi:MAG: hypothetical protein GX927_11770 [Lentisphaerae bacterium]|nr:hypothetical protein [Lentisphaerota bacterium]